MSIIRYLGNRVSQFDLFSLRFPLTFYRSSVSSSLPYYKYSLYCILLILLLPISALSQMELWTVGTAKTIPEHHLELSVFRPARFGITKSLEVSANPFAFIMFPHAQIKKNWYNRRFSVATVHGINYPSMALKMLKKRNKEEYLSEDVVVPTIFALKNELIISKLLKPKTTCDADNYLLSLKLGVQFASTSQNSTLTSIEKPMLYPRTEIYHKRTLWYAGLDLDARLNSFINYCIDVDYLSLGGEIKDYAIEHKMLVMTKLTNSLTIMAGYKLAYTTYDNKQAVNLNIVPLVDISWVYKFPKRKELGLFKD